MIEKYKLFEDDARAYGDYLTTSDRSLEAISLLLEQAAQTVQALIKYGETREFGAFSIICKEKTIGWKLELKGKK